MAIDENVLKQLAVNDRQSTTLTLIGNHDFLSFLKIAGYEFSAPTCRKEEEVSGKITGANYVLV